MRKKIIIIYVIIYLVIKTIIKLSSRVLKFIYPFLDEQFFFNPNKNIKKIFNNEKYSIVFFWESIILF
jgi:hypothetical protein